MIATDLDLDGDLDLVVTNLGLNTKYRAAPDKPMELFAKDFDDDGTVDVVEAKRSGDRTLPVRGLSCSSQAMTQGSCKGPPRSPYRSGSFLS